MISSNSVDIVILAIFLISIIIGFGRGLISEIISLITIIAAIILGILFASPLAEMFTSASSVQSVVNQTSSAMGVDTSQSVSYLALGICFALIFIGTLILGAIIKALLNIVMTTSILGIGNRLMGGMFGFLRGYLLNVVLIFVIQLTPMSTYAAWQQSRLVPHFQPAIVWLGSMVSPALDNLKSQFEATFSKSNDSESS